MNNIQKQSLKYFYDDAFPLFVFCFIGFIVLYFSGVRLPGDSRFVLLTAQSFIDGNWGDLSSYEYAIRSMGQGEVVRDEPGGLFYYFPIAPSIYVLPIYSIVTYFDPELSNAVRVDSLGNLQAFISIIYILMTCVVLYFILRRQGQSRAWAFVLLFLFLFATVNWSQSSRALWSHSPMILFLSCALFNLQKYQNSRTGLLWLGFFLGLAFTCRPTAVVPIVIISSYILFREKVGAWRYFAGASIIALPWIVFNLYAFHAIMPSYYTAGRVFTDPGLVPEALLGNLISPSRGLLVYSPWLLFVFVATFMMLRKIWRDQKHELETLETNLLVFVSMATIILHWILISGFPKWWAGFSYGPRFFIDVFPFLVVLAGALDLDEKIRINLSSLQVNALLYCLLISFVLNFRGAADTDPSVWNSKKRIDYNPERLWSINPPQFMYGLPWGEARWHFGTRLKPYQNLPAEITCQDQASILGTFAFVSKPSLDGSNSGSLFPAKGNHCNQFTLLPPSELKAARNITASGWGIQRLQNGNLRFDKQRSDVSLREIHLELEY